MLKIIIELHPHGDEKNKFTISELSIVNTGIKIDNQYVYTYWGWWKSIINMTHVIKKKTVSFDRTGSLYELVHKVISSFMEKGENIS